MSNRIQVICAWSGPAAVVIAFVGWLIAGVLPLPLGASSSTAQVVEFYRHDTRVMAGLVIASIGVSLVFALVAAIAIQMWRMEGRVPVLTVLQVVTGAATGVLLLLPMLLMAIISFRPERNPELTVTLNDIAWLLFLTPIGPFMIQNIAIGLAILGDARQTLPRWVGYLNFWVALAFIPDVMAFFFHSGPFAWNGVFVFWLALTAYSVFLIVMGSVVARASVSTRAPTNAATIIPTQ